MIIKAPTAVKAVENLSPPQIRHMLNDVKKVIDGKCPVDVIDMRDYGTLRGDKILAKALKMLGK